MASNTNYFFSMCAVLLCVGCSGQREYSGGELHWRIQHYRAPCVGEQVQLCYLVDRGAGALELFYDEIDGLSYQWGYNYDLLVEGVQLEQPMQDASSVRYRLKKLLLREPVSPDTTFSLPMRLNNEALITVRGHSCMLLDEIEIQVDPTTCARLSEQAAVDFRHGRSGEKLLPARASADW